MTRWAAASALEAIGYSQQSLQHLEGGGFTEPLDRIRREIRDRKLAEINRIQRLNSRGETTAEYERHLEFWIYGPADELLNGNENSRNYADIVGDVISKLHGRGVYLGLISPNSIVQGAALRQAGLIFKESAEIEKNLYGLLEEFLHNSNHETSLRIHAAEIINTATDLNRRLNTLIKLLLEKIELRNAAVRLLTPYKHDLTRVEPDADTVLDALVFSYSLNTLQKPQLQDLTISQLETYFPSASQYHREISEIFTSAIAASEALARRYGRTSSVLKEFLQNKQDEYLSAIESWIQLLRNQISETETENRKVQSNQDLINEAISLMRKKSDDRYSYYEKKGEEFVRFYPFPIPEKVCLLDQKFVLSNIDSHTYNLSHQIQRDLKSIKVYLLEFLIEKYRSEFTSGSSMSLPIPQLILDLFEFFDLFRHPQKILFVLCFFAILNIFVAVHSGSQGFTLSMILLILLIGIIYTFIVNQCKEDEKELKDLQSIINKLKTQWKE